MIPRREDLTICFAHAAYQMKTTFDALKKLKNREAVAAMRGKSAEEL